MEDYNDAIKSKALLDGDTNKSDLTYWWPKFLPSRLVNLGLDLRGGAHLLAEVNVEEVHAWTLCGRLLEMRLRPKEDKLGV